MPKLLGPDPYVSRPGSTFLYSSYGYNILAAIIEAATGRPFAEVLRDEVLVPLSLEATRIDNVRQVIPKRVRAYSYNYPWFSYTVEDSILRVPAFDYSYNFGEATFSPRLRTWLRSDLRSSGRDIYRNDRWHS